MNGQILSRQLAKYNKHELLSFTVFCHEQSSKSARKASALHHWENIDTTDLSGPSDTETFDMIGEPPLYGIPPILAS